MRNYVKLINLAKDNNGYIFTRDITRYNIPRMYLSYAASEGVIERIAPGIYVLPDVFVDELFIFQQLNSRVIYSAFTSAYLNELTTRDSEIIFGSAPRSYNSRKAFERNVIVREYPDTYNLGITTVKTMFGNYVTCHDIHRTVCDMFNARYVGDKFVQVEVLKNYLRRPDKDLTKLMEYAKILGVDKPLRAKLEVLI